MHNHIILLYTTTIHLPTRSHTTYFLHFRTRSIHPTRMSFLTTIPQKQVFLLFFTFSHLCITHPLGLISVYMCTCNMMQLSYELQLQRPGKGMLGPGSELPVNGVAVNADLNCRFERTERKMVGPTCRLCLSAKRPSPHFFKFGPDGHSPFRYADSILGLFRV